MKLFYHPAACSLASHTALAASGLPYQLVTVDRDKRTSDGRDFLELNPKGFVPALELDDGSVLAESVAVLAYIADRAGALLPTEGPARWKTLEAISFMATELHGAFKPFWKNGSQAEKDKAGAAVVKHLAVLAAELGERPYLIGDQLTIADPYLFVMLMWAGKHGFELPQPFGPYYARLQALPAFARALAEEGLT